MTLLFLLKHLKVLKKEKLSNLSISVYPKCIHYVKGVACAVTIRVSRGGTSISALFYKLLSSSAYLHLIFKMIESNFKHELLTIPITADLLKLWTFHFAKLL